MPKEMHLAARNNRGDELLYHENPYPPVNVVDMFEKYNKGSAKVLLEMARDDQRNSFEIANRASRCNFWRVVFGFSLTALFIACGTFLLYTGHYIVGSINVLIALLGLIGNIATDVRANKK